MAYLTVYLIVARVPEFMGGKLMCEFQVEEDTTQMVPLRIWWSRNQKVS